MKVGEVVYAAVASLVGERCYPLQFPQRPRAMTWPAIRYTVVSLVPSVGICGDSGVDAADYRVQLDLVATDYDEAIALGRDVAQAMASIPEAAAPAVLDQWREDSDIETGTYTVSLDYLLQSSSAADT